MNSRSVGCSGFQSHAGSIEAMRVQDGEVSALASFNPTLVRLRPSRWGGTSGNPIIRFQSHAGSIEAPRGPPSRWDTPRTFQSHAGSIEATTYVVTTTPKLKVSIPRWFD